MSGQPPVKKQASQRAIAARKIHKTQLLLDSVSQNTRLSPLKYPVPELASTCPHCDHDEEPDDVKNMFSDDPLDLKITCNECGERYHPIIAVNGDCKVLFLGPAQTRDQYAEYRDNMIVPSRRGDIEWLFQNAPNVAWSASVHAPRIAGDTHYTCVKRFLEPEPVPRCSGCTGTAFTIEFGATPAKVHCARITCSRAKSIPEPALAAFKTYFFTQ